MVYSIGVVCAPVLHNRAPGPPSYNAQPASPRPRSSWPWPLDLTFLFLSLSLAQIKLTKNGKLNHDEKSKNVCFSPWFLFFSSFSISGLSVSGTGLIGHCSKVTRFLDFTVSISRPYRERAASKALRRFGSESHRMWTGERTKKKRHSQSPKGSCATMTLPQSPHWTGYTRFATLCQ